MSIIVSSNKINIYSYALNNLYVWNRR